MLAVVLAFIFGCSLSLRPVLKAGVALSTALGASARRRYVVDCDHGGGGQAVMAVIPGAMGAGLWMSMAVSLVAAFVAAFPANGFLLARGKGHALMHNTTNPAKAMSATTKSYASPLHAGRICL